MNMNYLVTMCGSQPLFLQHPPLRAQQLPMWQILDSLSRERAPLDASVLPLEEKGGGAGVWRRSRSRWKEVQRGGRGDSLSNVHSRDCSLTLNLSGLCSCHTSVVTFSESCERMISSVGALALVAGSSYQQLQVQK